MRVVRADLLKVAALLAAPLAPSWPASASTVFFQADDKSWDLALPPTWRVDPALPRADPAHLFRFRATAPDNLARLDLTVDFTEPSIKSIKDLGSPEAAGQRFMATVPQPATLVQAAKLPRPDLFSTGPYQLRYRTAAASENVIKLAVQQGRIYKLMVELPAPGSAASDAVVLESEGIIDSFRAFPLNIGCLAASNRGGSLLPGVCY